MKKQLVNCSSLIAGAVLAMVFSDAAVAGASVTVTPRDISLAANGQQRFVASVSGGTSQDVTWLVNGVPGGAPGIGTITADGVYQAPAGESERVQVSIAAASKADPLSSGTASASVDASATSGVTYYVAPHGDDAAAGTAAAPWRTVQHAVDVASAGTTIQLAGGTYNELVTLGTSGSASAGYITITSAKGQKATIDGTGLNPSGTQGVVTLGNVSYVRITGLELKGLESSDAENVPAGIYFEGTGDHIEIRNNDIHDIKTNLQTSAGNAFGVAIYGTDSTPVSNVIIDGNTLHDLTLGYSESLSVNGNVSQWQVTHNTIYHNNNIGIDAIGLEGTSKVDDQARNGWIADNTIDDITSTRNPAYKNKPAAGGIYVDGGAYITIERNSVRTSDIGIELASEHGNKLSSHIVARSNVLQDNLVTGLSIGGFEKEAGGTTYASIINNTFVNNDTSISGSGELQIQFNASNNLVSNNIFYANKQGLMLNSIDPNGPAPALFENNVYFGAVDISRMSWKWHGVSYATLKDFQDVSQAVRGLVADPHFVGSGKYPLRISTDSQAVAYGIRKGLALEGSMDKAGAPRVAPDGGLDGGAFQH